MDPNKSSSGPSEWAGEKSSMGQAPPPPYQDNPNPGYPQPGYPQPGYPQPGYPQPGGPAYPPQAYGGLPYGQPQYPAGQQYPGQMATVCPQPTVCVARTPLAEPVNDYLCYSIFTMLCCCLPLGIAALIYSISAREANYAGDQLGAERSSRTARTLNHVALGLGLGVFILTIVYVVVMTSMLSH